MYGQVVAQKLTGRMIKKSTWAMADFFNTIKYKLGHLIKVRHKRIQVDFEEEEEYFSQRDSIHNDQNVGMSTKYSENREEISYTRERL